MLEWDVFVCMCVYERESVYECVYVCVSVCELAEACMCEVVKE